MEIEANQDLTREWKVIKTFKTSTVMFHSDFQVELEDHAQHLKNMAREARRQAQLAAKKTKAEIAKEEVAAIKSCEYEQYPNKKEPLYVDQVAVKVSLIQDKNDLKACMRGELCQERLRFA